MTLCSPQADIIQMPRSTGVGNAWSNDLSPYAFQIVHERLRVVLSFIIHDRCVNALTEQIEGQ